MGGRAFGVGAGGFLVPFVAGLAVCRLFGVGKMPALFIGLGLSIAAIAVNARVLKDMALLHTFRISPVIMGASLIDDVLSFAFLTAIIGMTASGGVINWRMETLGLVTVFLFFGLSVFAGMRLYPRLSRYFAYREAKGPLRYPLSKNQGSLASTSVILIVFSEIWLF